MTTPSPARPMASPGQRRLAQGRRCWPKPPLDTGGSMPWVNRGTRPNARDLRQLYRAPAQGGSLLSGLIRKSGVET